MDMIQVTRIPIEGYANLYEHRYRDINGNELIEYCLGKVSTEKSQLPQHYEYDCVAHKHMGIVKVTISDVIK